MTTEQKTTFFRFDDLRIYHKVLDYIDNCRSKTQFVYFLKLGKTALRECIVLTTIARRMDLISEADEEVSRSILIEVSKMNRALITSLQKEHKKRNTDNEDYSEEDYSEHRSDLDATLNSNIMNY